MNAPNMRREALAIAGIGLALVGSVVTAYVIRLSRVEAVLGRTIGFLDPIDDPGAPYLLVLGSVGPGGLVFFGYLVALALTGRRVTSWAISSAVFSLTLVTVLAHQFLASHLDPVLWAEGGPVGWRVNFLSAVLIAALASSITWWVARRWGMESFTRDLERRPRASAGITSDQEAVWFGRTKAPRAMRALTYLVITLLTVLLVVPVTLFMVNLMLSDYGLPKSIGLIEIGFGPALTLFIAFIGLSASYVGVRVGPRGVTISSGPWRLPIKRIDLSEISMAQSEPVSPVADFGGWGFRWRPSATGVIIRAGEALWLKKGERWFVITVDDAEEAAGVVNDLIASRAPTA